MIWLSALLAACISNPSPIAEEARAPEKKSEQSLPIPIAPFATHEERYQELFIMLQNKGLDADYILNIFSSTPAKIRDQAAVKRISKKWTGITTLTKKSQMMRSVNRIKAHLAKHKSTYDRLEKEYGVNREIVAAILFKETDLGQFNNWQHDAFTVLNNILSFVEIPPAGTEQERKRINRVVAISQASLAELIAYSHKYNIDLSRKKFPSSYAGAIGMPQFMPIYLSYAVSSNNGVPDLSKTADAILSVGNLLKNRFDWPGLMDLNKLQVIDKINRQYIEWDKYTDNASFCKKEDSDGYPLRRFVDEIPDAAHIDYIAQYCSVLMNYNFSSNYVLDTLRLAATAKQ